MRRHGGERMGGIFVVGANGCGKTTLARALAERLGFRHIDIEDYSFEPSDVPYSRPRDRETVREMIKKAMQEWPDFVFSAVNGDWGEAICRHCSCIVYLHAPQEVRMARIEQRSLHAMGKRVQPDGDLYAQEQAFLHFVRTRTMEKTDCWVESMNCPVFHMDATQPTAQLVQDVMARLEKMNL